MDHPLPDAAAFRDAETGLVMALPKGRILKELTPLLAEAGFLGVMLDTADKSAGGLRRHLDPVRLAAFVAGVKIGAGSMLASVSPSGSGTPHTAPSRR